MTLTFRGRMALGLVLGACGTPPMQPPVPTPVPLSDSRAPVAMQIETPSPRPVSLLDLADRGDLKLLAIVEPEGCAATTRQWIVSALDTHGEGATCIGDGTSAPACVLFAGVTPDHLSDVMCARRSAARPVLAPAWAPEVLAWMRTVPADQSWQVSPVIDAAQPAFALQIDDELFVAIRTEDGWRRSEKPVDQTSRLAARRVLDTSELTDSSSFGVITSSYDGGSGSGTETTTLSVLRPTATGLAAVATIQLGQFTWILAAEHRRNHPKAATSLEARPHVEVQLVPEFAPGVLSLRVERDVISKELVGRCVKGEDEDLNPPCVREAMKARAGRYRLIGDGFSAMD